MTSVDIAITTLTDIGATFNPGGYYQASGAASSTSSVSADEGYYMIEEQDLYIDYVRVPSIFPRSHELSLSGYETSTVHWSTHLEAVVTASYTVKKVWGMWATRTFTQPQEFEITTASSLHGHSYGGVVNASGLGVAGSINTKQKWHNRRPWNDTVDQEIDQRAQCCTMALMSSGSGWIKWSHRQSRYFSDYDIYAMEEHWKYSPLDGYPSTPRVRADVGSLYHIRGGFHVDKENSEVNIRRFVDNIGDFLSNSGSQRPRLYRLNPRYSDGHEFLQEGDLAGIIAYRVNRHKYS